jgi:hypothetical protein
MGGIMKPRLTIRRMMASILIIALLMTLVIQQIQLRRASSREERLRAALVEAEAKAAWNASLDEWQGLGDSQAIKQKWAKGSKRASTPGGP